MSKTARDASPFSSLSGMGPRMSYPAYPMPYAYAPYGYGGYPYSPYAAYAGFPVTYARPGSPIPGHREYLPEKVNFVENVHQRHVPVYRDCPRKETRVHHRHVPVPVDAPVDAPYEIERVQPVRTHVQDRVENLPYDVPVERLVIEDQLVDVPYDVPIARPVPRPVYKDTVEYRPTTRSAAPMDDFYRWTNPMCAVHGRSMSPLP